MENKIAEIIMSDLDETDKMKAIGDTYGTGLGNVVRLEMETGIDLPSVEAEFFNKAYEACLAENNPFKSSEDFGEIEVEKEEEDDGRDPREMISRFTNGRQIFK